MLTVKKIWAKISALRHHESKRNTFLALTGNLLYSVLGFVGIALLARSLELSEYGNWVIYLTAGSLLEMMRLGFMHTALVRFSSGASEETQKQYIASAWIIGFIFTLILALLIFAGYLIVFFLQVKTSYVYFLKYYPLLSLLSLPLSISSSILQFKMLFGKMVFLRLISMSLNLLVFFAAFLLKFHIETLVLLHLISALFASVFAFLKKWSGLEWVRFYSKEKIKELSHFGKYSLGTLIGTNLLKSADTFILGFCLGADSAALYSIPLKLTETFEILLRSIVSVALPKMSGYSVKKQYAEVQRVFQDYSGMLTFIYIPVMLICFIFAEFLLHLLGGPEYVHMAGVFRVFCLYGLLLPIDRFTGVTLDCLNLPALNFTKVLAMALFNIGFDFLALHFSTDLKWVAFGTVLTTGLGIILGLKFLNTSFPTNLYHILKSGFSFIRKNKISIIGN